MRNDDTFIAQFRAQVFRISGTDHEFITGFSLIYRRASTARATTNATLRIVRSPGDTRG